MNEETRRFTDTHTVSTNGWTGDSVLLLLLLLWFGKTMGAVCCLFVFFFFGSCVVCVSCKLWEGPDTTWITKPGQPFCLVHLSFWKKLCVTNPQNGSGQYICRLRLQICGKLWLKMLVCLYYGYMFLLLNLFLRYINGRERVCVGEVTKKKIVILLYYGPLSMWVTQKGWDGSACLPRASLVLGAVAS